MNTQMINDMMSKQERSKLFLDLLCAFRADQGDTQSSEFSVKYGLADLISFADLSQYSVPQVMALSDQILTRKSQQCSEQGACRFDYQSLRDSCPTNSDAACLAAMMLAGIYFTDDGWQDGPNPVPGVLIDLSGLNVDRAIADVPEVV